MERRESRGALGVSDRRDGPDLAFRKPDGEHEPAQQRGGSGVARDGGSGAPFAGSDPEPESVGAIFRLFAPLFGVGSPDLGRRAQDLGLLVPVIRFVVAIHGVLAAVFRSVVALLGAVAGLLGAVAELLGSVALVLVRGPDAGGPGRAAKLLFERRRT